MVPRASDFEPRICPAVRPSHAAPFAGLGLSSRRLPRGGVEFSNRLGEGASDNRRLSAAGIEDGNTGDSKGGIPGLPFSCPQYSCLESSCGRVRVGSRRASGSNPFACRTFEVLFQKARRRRLAALDPLREPVPQGAIPRAIHVCINNATCIWLNTNNNGLLWVPDVAKLRRFCIAFGGRRKPEGFGSSSPGLARQGFGGRAYPGTPPPAETSPKPERFASAHRRVSAPRRQACRRQGRGHRATSADNTRGTAITNDYFPGLTSQKSRYDPGG